MFGTGLDPSDGQDLSVANRKDSFSSATPTTRGIDCERHRYRLRQRPYAPKCQSILHPTDQTCTMIPAKADEVNRKPSLDADLVMEKANAGIFHCADVDLARGQGPFRNFCEHRRLVLTPGASTAFAAGPRHTGLRRDWVLGSALCRRGHRQDQAGAARGT